MRRAPAHTRPCAPGRIGVFRERESGAERERQESEPLGLGLTLSQMSDGRVALLPMGTDAVAGAHGQNAREIILRVTEGGQQPMAAIIGATSHAAESLLMFVMKGGKIYKARSLRRERASRVARART
jgi:hypothetical protein